MNQNGNKKYIVNSLQQKLNKKYNMIPVEKNDVLVKAKYENNIETILFFRLGKPVDGRCIAKCVNIKEEGKWSFPPQRIYLSEIHVEKNYRKQREISTSDMHQIVIKLSDFAWKNLNYNIIHIEQIWVNLIRKKS